MLKSFSSLSESSKMNSDAWNLSASNRSFPRITEKTDLTCRLNVVGRAQTGGPEEANSNPQATMKL